MSSVDAFGRLRVCNPFTLFDFMPSPLSSASNSARNRDIWVTRFVSSGGSPTCDYDTQNYVYLRLPICSAGSNVSVTRFTKQPIIYQPGKSRLFMFSFLALNRAIVSGADVGVISRAGVFN